MGQELIKPIVRVGNSAGIVLPREWLNGKAKVELIEKPIDIKRDILEILEPYLEDVVGIPFQDLSSEHVFHLYVVRADRRDDLQRHLSEKGISSGIHYPTPIHLQPVFAHLGYSEGDFPVAEKASKEILSLPMYPELEESQIKYVCDAIKEFYKR